MVDWLGYGFWWDLGMILSDCMFSWNLGRISWFGGIIMTIYVKGLLLCLYGAFTDFETKSCKQGANPNFSASILKIGSRPS